MHAQEELARVGILKFSDTTGTRLFGYMPKTLRDAIDSSLQKKFEYTRVNPELIDRFQGRLPITRNLSEQEIRSLAQATRSDVVVYGYFTYAQEKNVLNIHPFIYVAAEDRFLALNSTSSPVDDSLFEAVDRVASEVVRAMAKLAQEAQAERKDGPHKHKITTDSLAKEQKSPRIPWGLFAGLEVSYAAILGELQKLIPNSLWLKLFVEKLFLKNILLGVEYRLFGSHIRQEFEGARQGLFMEYLALTGGYLYPLRKDFSLVGRLALGWYGVQMSHGSRYFFDEYGGPSLGLRYKLNHFLSLDTQFSLLFLQSRPKSLWQAGLGAAVVALF